MPGFFVVLLIRRLLREKLFTGIALGSLVVGITSFLVIISFLNNELSYDRYHENEGRIYRLISNFGSNSFAVSAEGLGPLLTENYGELGQYTRLRPLPESLVEYRESSIYLNDSYYADANVFAVFSHSILSGDPDTAFSDPYSIAISEEVATTIFGAVDPVGEVVDFAGQQLTVKLVYGDIPSNTHLRYEALLPYSLRLLSEPWIEENYIRDLWNTRTYTYLFVESDFLPTSFRRISDDFYAKFMVERSIESGQSFIAELQPLASIHYGRKLLADLKVGNIFYIYSFALIGILILFVSCINYVNLSTARATKQIKEIGLSKVLGANRLQMFSKIFLEAFIFTTIATLIAVSLGEFIVASTSISIWMGSEEPMSIMRSQSMIIFVVLAIFPISALSGIYPAFYLSSISSQPKNIHGNWKGAFGLRQILVLLQLAVATAIISSTFIMYKQIEYVEGKPLGFEKENRALLTLKGSDIMESFPYLKSELSRHPGVLSVALGSPPGFGGNKNTVEMETTAGAMRQQSADFFVVDSDYAESFGIFISEGRSFLLDRETDKSNAALVNEELARQMNWDDPIGKGIVVNGAVRNVVGVTADYHYDSLHNLIGPLVIIPSNTDYSAIPPVRRDLTRTRVTVAFTPNETSEVFEHIRQTISDFDPSQVVEIETLESQLSKLYEAESNVMWLTSVFALVCLSLCAMGLIGLIAFSGERRRKEIGIRKVLGASRYQLAVMLAWNFAILSVMAAIPSSFVSYYVMENWLENFVYRAEFSIFPYLVAVISVLVLVLITTVLQTLSVTRVNPLNVLRYE